MEKATAVLLELQCCTKYVCLLRLELAVRSLQGHTGSSLAESFIAVQLRCWLKDSHSGLA